MRDFLRNPLTCIHKLAKALEDVRERLVEVGRLQVGAGCAEPGGLRLESKAGELGHPLLQLWARDERWK